MSLQKERNSQDTSTNKKRQSLTGLLPVTQRRNYAAHIEQTHDHPGMDSKKIPPKWHFFVFRRASLVTETLGKRGDSGGSKNWHNSSPLRGARGGILFSARPWPNPWGAHHSKAQTCVLTLSDTTNTVRRHAKIPLHTRTK